MRVQPIRYFNTNIRAVLLAWLVEEATDEERKQLRKLVSCVTVIEPWRGLNVGTASCGLVIDRRAKWGGLHY